MTVTSASKRPVAVASRVVDMVAAFSEVRLGGERKEGRARRLCANFFVAANSALPPNGRGCHNLAQDGQIKAERSVACVQIISIIY